MNTKIIFVSLILGLLLVSSVSAYYCIDKESPNTELMEFRAKMNKLFIENELRQGYTMESILIKNELFGGCEEW